LYDKTLAAANVTRFMASSKPDDPYSPVMVSLRDQNGLSSMVDYMDVVSAIFIAIFVTAMSLVLWNAGLLGGLRRYGEVGVRMAVGESKGHVYRSMIWESVLIGVIGSMIGTAIGLTFSFWLQKHGIDVSGFMKNASMMIPAVLRAEVSPSSFYIGFIPGLFATVIGTSLAGIGIYKRKTAQLFKELE
jgi:putative ABC transport system permease protein